MGIKFSASTCGFYVSGIHVEIPGDAVDISKEEYQRLLEMQSEGHLIVADQSGHPTLKPVEVGSLVFTSCTPAQGLVALFVLQEITETHILEAIAQIPDQVQQYTARIGYQNAKTWERGSPTMLAMAQLLQLTEQDLDDLFTYAVTVQV